MFTTHPVRCRLVLVVDSNCLDPICSSTFTYGKASYCCPVLAVPRVMHARALSYRPGFSAMSIPGGQFTHLTTTDGVCFVLLRAQHSPLGSCGPARLCRAMSCQLVRPGKRRSHASTPILSRKDDSPSDRTSSEDVAMRDAASSSESYRLG